MRIVIMGTGPFAVPTAQALVDDGHQIALVVTRPVPDPTAKKLPQRPIYDWANGLGLTIFEPKSINEPAAIATVQNAAADLLFVCDYGQILSKACLGTARLGGINLHGSLLPRHRGAAPVQWSLLRGDEHVGVTVIHMTPRLDAGPALAIASTTVAADETAEQLEPRLAVLGIGATRQAVGLLADWDGRSTLGDVQDQTLVTPAPRFTKSHGALDFRLPADYLVRLVRACQPWPGTFADLVWPDGKTMRLIVRAARCLADVPSILQDAPAGTCVALDAAELGGTQRGDWSAPWQRLLATRTADGVLLIGRAQPAGRRVMDVEELLRGYPLIGAAHFTLPESPPHSLV